MSGPPWLPVPLAFLAGACEPQVGGALRALWPGLTPLSLRPAAMALPSVIFEVSVLAGPLLLAPAPALALAGRLKQLIARIEAPGAPGGR